MINHTVTTARASEGAMAEKFRLNSFATVKESYESVLVGDIGRITAISAGIISTSARIITIKFADGIPRVVPLALLDHPPKALGGGIGSKVKCRIHYEDVKKDSVGTLVGNSRDINRRDCVEVAFENGSYTIHWSYLSQLNSLESVLSGLSGLFGSRSSSSSSKSSFEERRCRDGKQTIEDIRASFGPTIPHLSYESGNVTFIDEEEEEVEDIPTSLLRTEDVPLISHVHGRQRREERNIQRKELQAAIKYGTKQIANPGRDGSKRYRYEHMGVVYITDESSRHEVTSWRIDGKDDDDSEEDEIAPAEIALEGTGCHAVLIVDNSGSMRASDVAGYETRAKAVYHCLKNDFAKEQIRSGAADDVVVTLISMSIDAKVLIETKPLNTSFIKDIERISKRRPKSHGNYLPALDKALEVMKSDAPNRSNVLLLFFSDGAPSDHQFIACEHGVKVFEIDRKLDPKMQHSTTGSAWHCRKKIIAQLEKDCCNRVRRIGQVFGRDRVIVRTIAFGPTKEDFSLLEKMAKVLPRGEFQRLGLSADKLKTAFSSFSSSLLTLRTEGGGGLRSSLTRRSDKVVDRNQKVDQTLTNISEEDGWYIYAFDDFIGKYQFKRTGTSNNIKLTKSAPSLEFNGFAFYENPFAEGNHHCNRVVSNNSVLCLYNLLYCY